MVTLDPVVRHSFGVGGPLRYISSSRLVDGSIPGLVVSRVGCTSFFVVFMFSYVNIKKCTMTLNRNLGGVNDG